MRPFDCVVLSTNLDPLYWQFATPVAQAWKKLFNCPVHLAIVGPQSREREFQNAFSSEDFNSILWLPTLPGVPEANQAKLARYFVASNLNAMTRVMIHDIDYLPLNADLIRSQLGERTDGAIVASGAELYTDREAGKFMAAPLIADAGILSLLFRPTHLGWPEFIDGLKGYQKFDAKENILSAIDHEHPDTFSDESLLRALLANHPAGSITVVHRSWHERKQIVDRSNWKEDIAMFELEPDAFAGSHLPRPLLKHFTAIHPLLQHVGV